MIKVCFYGAESTGKSTMAKRVAEAYKTSYVPEVAREMISSNDFSVDDIIRIGHAQTDRIRQTESAANGLLICDTDIITTQIYSITYLGVIPEILLELESMVSFDRYFLFDIDVPWVADGLRDLKEKREEMHKVFKHQLEVRGIDWITVRGNWETRFKIIRTEIDHMLGQSKEL